MAMRWIVVGALLLGGVACGDDSTQPATTTTSSGSAMGGSMQPPSQGGGGSGGGSGGGGAGGDGGATLPAHHCEVVGTPGPSLVWWKSFGDDAPQAALDVALSSQGAILLTGAFEGTLNFGGADLQAQMLGPFGSAFFARLDATGAHLDSTMFSGSNAGSGLSVDVDANDEVSLTGALAGPSASTDFGTGPVLNPAAIGAYVTKLGQWSAIFGDAGAWAITTAAALGDDGSIVIAGCVKGAIDLGGGPFTASPNNGDCGDPWVLKLDPSGAYVWSLQMSGAAAEDTQILGLDVDAAGNTYFAMQVEGTIDAGGGPITALGVRDLVLTKLNPGGSHAWSSRYGDASTFVTTASVVADGVGEIIVSGIDFGGSIDFGFGTLPTTSDGTTPFVAKFAPSGAPIWSVGGTEAFDAAAIDRGALAVDAQQSIYAGMMKLDADGNTMWRIESCVAPKAVALSGDDIVYTGSFAGLATFDGKSIQSTASNDGNVFVAVLTSTP